MKWDWMSWTMVAAFAVGCTADGPSDEIGDARDGTFLSADGKADAFGVSEGSPLAVGVLRLVNTAPVELLDDDVPLDSRASSSIVGHRDGPDGQLGTVDDDLIDTLAELDRIPWVGPRSFGALVEYARDNGYVDLATGSPEQTLPGPTAERTGFGYATLDDGRLLIVGGASGWDGPTNSGEVYDPAQQVWTPIAPMSVARESPTATVLDDGRVLVAGGVSPGSEYGKRTAEIWDPTTDTWSDGGTFEGGRYDHSASKLDDGRVVLIGGKSSYRAYTHVDVSVYDPATNSWEKTGVTPVGVDGHTATLTPDGKVLIVGGYNRFNKYRTRAIMVFDPATDNVTVVAHAKVGRSDHDALVVGNELWVFGGTSDRDRAVSSVEAIDLLTYEVRELPPMVNARYQHTVATLPNGDIVALGGRDENGRTLKDVDVWNPATGEWELGPSMQTPHFGGASFITSQGVLMVGGETEHSENPASTLYVGGPSTPVNQPGTETIVDWMLLPHFGERFSCEADQLVHHEASGQLICFKGRAAENEPIGTYAWTPNGWVEILDESESPVPPRTLHAMTYDSARGKIVLFGGQKRYGYDLNDVWEFDGTSWTLVQPATAVAPPNQRMARLVYDSSRQRAVLMPGYVEPNISTEMFAWDGSTWTTIAQNNGGSHFGTDQYDARRGYGAAYDATRDRIVIFGGWANGHATSTMEFDGQSWSNGGSGGPGSRGRIDATFDPETGTILAAGTFRTGNSSLEQHGVWRYENGRWSAVNTEHTFSPYSAKHGVAFTPELGVVIGGASLFQLGEYVRPNHRPNLSYVGSRTIYPNEPFALTVDATDPDGHDLIVTADGLPDGASFDPDTLTLEWTPRPDQGGEYTVSFTATDGALSKTTELNVTVEGLISYPMLPTGTIDMSGSVTMSGTVRDRRRTGYEQRGGHFRVNCTFTGQNPGRVLYTCDIVNASRWPWDITVVTSGQLRPDGRMGANGQLSGYVEALQWDDYELHVTNVDVSWQQGQELWDASGDHAGYLTRN